MSSAPTVSDLEIPGPDAPVPCRLYSPDGEPEGALVWAHGGAFAWGDLDMPEAHAVSSWLAARGWLVLSVGYRLAPEPSVSVPSRPPGGHPFPAAHRDVIAAFEWMVARARQHGIDRPFLGGASAGANLATGAAVALRDSGSTAPAGLMLAYPLLHNDIPAPAGATQPDLEDIPRERAFPPDLVRAFNLNYVAGDESLLTDPRVYPGEGDVAGLPPTIIVNSQWDDLRPSGEAFAEQLEAASVPVECTFEPGTFHGHLDQSGGDDFTATLTTFLDWLRVGAAAR